MSEHENEQVQTQLVAGIASTDVRPPGALGLLAGDEAMEAQRRAQQAMQRRHEDSYAKERASERAERYDLQNIVNRQTAIHAALMLEPKPPTPDELIEASKTILAFLTAKD